MDYGILPHNRSIISRSILFWLGNEANIFFNIIGWRILSFNEMKYMPNLIIDEFFVS